MPTSNNSYFPKTCGKTSSYESPGCSNCSSANCVAGPIGPTGPRGPMGPIANVINLKGVLKNPGMLSQITGEAGDCYLVGTELYIYSPLSGKFEDAGPVNMAGALAADPTGVAAYGEVYTDEPASYRGMVTYPVRIRMPCQSPPYNVLYDPEDAITILDSGLYEITRRLSYKAAENNAISSAILRNGSQLPRSVTYSEGEPYIVDRSMSFLEELCAGDVLELWAVSLRNTLSMTVYHASIIVKRLG